jgi:hypothetical protein
LLRCKHRQHTAEEYLEQYRIVYSCFSSILS